ncbi:hypothetical protein MTR67_052684 [Solanum verrucosum]|uniref:Uncharacterized protein n=1 Tax=Solanum verrucosum TaxID=315347 RepID=A0AAF1A3Q1_SOLVR|nr:hypothetical protein MTR67_052684 [Solanum verrucosum]
MIEPDGSLWYPAKDATRALKDFTMCTWKPKFNMVIATTFKRRAFTRLSSWLKKARDTDQCTDWMLPHVMDGLRQYWNTYKFKAMSEQAKKARDSLNGGSLHTGGAKSIGTITREMISSNSNF